MKIENRQGLIFLVVMGVLTVMVCNTLAEAPTFVTGTYTDATGLSQSYSLANKPIRIYTSFGMRDYPLTDVVKISRHVNEENCELVTTHGDRLKGKLISESFPYFYYDTEKWLTIGESRAFELVLQNKLLVYDNEAFSKISLNDGSEFFAYCADASLSLPFSEGMENVPLASLFDVSFQHLVQNDDDKMVADVNYADGLSIHGLLGNRYVTFPFVDTYGKKLDLSLEQIKTVQGVQRFLMPSPKETKTNTWLKVAITMEDGREERAWLPFFIGTVKTRGGVRFGIPTPLIESIRWKKNSEVILTTLFGDQIAGRFEASRLMIRSALTDAETMALKVTHIRSLTIENKPIQVWSDTAKLEINSSLFLGMSPNGQLLHLKPRDHSEEIDLSLSAVLFMARKGVDWHIVTETTSLVARISNKTLDWMTFADGVKRSFRWRDIDSFGIQPVEAGKRLLAEKQTKPTEREKIKEPALPKTVKHETSPSSLALPRMRAGHLLQITVLVAGEMEIDDPGRRVSSRGELSLPLLGNVRAEGLTLDELATELTARYKIYFLEPQVVIQYVMDEDGFGISPWGYVTVLGTVKEPGKVRIPPTQDLTVSMAIQQAGGFDKSAKDTAIRITRKGADGTHTQYDINLRNVGSRGELKNDMPLQPGDIVYVPEMMF